MSAPSTSGVCGRKLRGGEACAPILAGGEEEEEVVDEEDDKDK